MSCSPYSRVITLADMRRSRDQNKAENPNIDNFPSLLNKILTRRHAKDRREDVMLDLHHVEQSFFFRISCWLESCDQEMRDGKIVWNVDEGVARWSG